MGKLYKTVKGMDVTNVIKAVVKKVVFSLIHSWEVVRFHISLYGDTDSLRLESHK